MRDKSIPISRGMITDRNGEPLAVSTPVDSIWAQPAELLRHRDRLPELARALAVDAEDLELRLAQRADREFVFLRRRMPPDQSAAIVALEIPGVNAQREYRRFYPLGRDHRAHPRLHQHRRSRPGRPGTGLRRLAGRQARRSSA